MKYLIAKLQESKLVGRGGACFPTALKWGMVKEAQGNTKYIICNASEGEPGVKKDGYILKNYCQQVIDGIEFAIEYLSDSKPAGSKNIRKCRVKAYIYLNPSYYKKYASKIKRLAGKLPIELHKKHLNSGYIGGEETAAINAIEGGRVEPRLRPPFPTTDGLWECPTLVNNVETFYSTGLIALNRYEHKRFYTINGDCLWTGVYALSERWTIEKILKETKNYPKFDFFVQVGGDASGEVLNSQQLNRLVSGSGSITVYSVIKHNPMELIRKWIEFFAHQSCGQCSVCREGTFRLRELTNKDAPDWQKFADLLVNLRDTSFCGLGCVVPIPLKTYIENVLSKYPDKRIKFPKLNIKAVCDCFK